MDEKTVVPQRPMKSPGLAGILSVIFPFGAGALYNGQLTKALFHLIIFSGLVYSQRYGGGQPFMGIFLGAFYIYQIFDAIHSARAINTAGQPAGAYGEQGLPETFKSGSIFWGILLIVLGVVLILANFEIILYSTLADFWPVAVIAVGLKLVLESLAKSKEK